MTSDKNRRVIGVGLACLDQLLLWEDMAAPVLGNTIVATDLQGGGMASTAMMAVSRLGGEAELWTALGEDWVSEQILRGLESEGVDTGQVTRVGGGRSVYVQVCVDRKTGERHFMHSTDWDRPDGAFGELSRIAGAGCLLIDHWFPESELRAAQVAQRIGVPVVSDTEKIREWHPNVFPYVDYAIVSERAARELSDNLHEACLALRQLGAKIVVVTLGDKGLVYLDGDTYAELPAFKVSVVDTTGAGDVFHGAFCYGLTQGFPLEQNLRFASATSALKCTQIGGRAGIPTREQVEVFLRRNGDGP